MSIQFIYCVTHIRIVLTSYNMSTFAHIHGPDNSTRVRANLMYVKNGTRYRAHCVASDFDIKPWFLRTPYPSMREAWCVILRSSISCLFDAV
jgi:hypothetical protein